MQNSCSTGRAARPGIALLLALGLCGCSAGMAYRSGQAEGQKGNWDMAVARLTKASQQKPGNVGYKIALENARIQASRHHFAEARKAQAAKDLAKAAEELEIASNYDPSNKSASDERDIVREQLRKQEDEARRLSEFDTMKERALTRRSGTPVLSPRSTSPITLKWSEQSLQKLYETLGRLAGVNVIFDADFRDKNWSVTLTGVTFEEALDQISFVNRLFYKVLDQNTIIVSPDSQQKRRAYDEEFLQTFYLQNAEVKDVETVVKAVMGTGARISSNATLGAITVAGTADNLALAQRIIELNDKARGEVMVEVQVLEVDRTRTKKYGIALSQYNASVDFSPTGGTTTSGSGTTTTTGSSDIVGGLTNLRAHLLSSLNLADFIVHIPANLSAQFLQTDQTTKILASPRLRAAEGKKTTLKIGQEVPVPVTTFQATQTGAGTFTPATSFQYRNVGVTMDLTPKVSASGDITLEMQAEFSIPGGQASLGGQLLPTFLTRNVTGILRVRDGETTLIGGLLQSNDTETMTGLLGLQNVPILNRLFRSTDPKTKEETEILISITPHLVRAPKLREQDLMALPIGTRDIVRLPNARPPLIGAPEEVASPKPEVAGSKPAAVAAPAGAPAPPAVTPGAAGTAPTVGSSAALAPVASTPTPIPAPTPAPQAQAGAPAPASVEGTANPGPSTARVAFSPTEAGVKLGQTGTLALVVVGAQDVRGIDLVVAYDLAVVQAVDVLPGSLLTLDGATIGAEKGLEPGRVRVRFTRGVPTAGSGEVVVLSFKGLSAGGSAVTIESMALVTSTGRQPLTPAIGRIVVTQ